MSTKLTIYTTEQILSRCDIGKAALWKRLNRADNKDGLLYIEGLGNFIVRRPGKIYQIIKVNNAGSEDIIESTGGKDITAEIIEQLVNMREVVCDDCRVQIVDRVIKQLEEK